MLLFCSFELWMIIKIAMMRIIIIIPYIVQSILFRHESIVSNLHSGKIKADFGDKNENGEI